MAPEVKSGNYGMSSDVYSIGLVLYEIFEKKLPNFDPETKITTVPKQFGVCFIFSAGYCRISSFEIIFCLPKLLFF
jgi:serine/threonine protein kinase